MGPQGGWFFHKAATVAIFSFPPLLVPCPVSWVLSPVFPISLWPGINVNESHWNVNMTFNASMRHALKPDCAIKHRTDGAIHVSIATPPISSPLRSWPKKREVQRLKSIGKHQDSGRLGGCGNGITVGVERKWVRNGIANFPQQANTD